MKFEENLIHTELYMNPKMGFWTMVTIATPTWGNWKACKRHNSTQNKPHLDLGEALTLGLKQVIGFPYTFHYKKPVFWLLLAVP